METGLLAAVAAYFVPFLVAMLRNHHQTHAIFALNLLLGWSGIGWIAALIWSLTAVRTDAASNAHSLMPPSRTPR